MKRGVLAVLFTASLLWGGGGCGPARQTATEPSARAQEPAPAPGPGPEASAPAPAPAAPAEPDSGPEASAPAPAPAPEAATPFQYRHIDHTNLSSTGDLGVSSDTWLDSRVVLEPAAGGQVKVLDVGVQGESSATSEGWSSAEKTRWRNSWTGTKSEKADGFRLELVLADRSCETTITREVGTGEGVHGSTTKQACPEVARRVTFECAATTLAIGPDFLGPPSEARAREVWTCLPVESDYRPPATPPPWVFSAEECLESTSDSPFLGGGRLYRLCPVTSW